MKIAEKILAKLEKECPHSNNESVPYPLEIKEQGLKIRTELIDFDRLGCTLHRIALEDEEVSLALSKSGCPVDKNRRLEHLSCQITKKITYLLEDITVIEWDKNTATLLMRSHPPESNNRYISYYEFCLSQGSYLSLTRYRYNRKTGRKIQEPIHLTKEVFVRLINDLATFLQTQESE
jgi:hypothetical protein